MLLCARGFRLWAARRAAPGGPGVSRDLLSRAGELDRYGGVSVHLARLGALQGLDTTAFRKLLLATIQQWQSEGRTAVWLHIPIQQSRFIAPAASLGFCFHHAESDSSTLTLWLGEGPSRLPGYATHQVGVAGDTAVREVFEETGIKSEFQSLLSIRQQHTSPGAFGKSDMYIICRLRPYSFTIDFCPHECLRCEWMDVNDLAKTENTTPITHRVARLLLYGYREGFDKIDFTMEELPAVHTGLFYKLYHKELPESYKTITWMD